MAVKARTVVLLVGVATAFGTVAAPTVSAARLTCESTQGNAVTAGDGVGACSATADQSSRAIATTTDGVAYAGAEAGAFTAAAGTDGGVGAAEATGGFAAALALGAGAVTIVSADSSSFAFAVAGAGAQASVGTAAEGVVCRGLALAVDVSTGQLCLSDGVSTVELPGSRGQ